jgi:hypothetical protein
MKTIKHTMRIFAIHQPAQRSLSLKISGWIDVVETYNFSHLAVVVWLLSLNVEGHVFYKTIFFTWNKSPDSKSKEHKSCGGIWKSHRGHATAWQINPRNPNKWKWNCQKYFKGQYNLKRFFLFLQNFNC